MGHKTEITFDENVFCLRIAPLELQKIKIFLPQQTAVSKMFSKIHLKGDFHTVYEMDVLFVLFQQNIYRGVILLRQFLIWCIIIRYEC